MPGNDENGGAIIEIRGLLVRFNDHVVLEGVDLDVRRGEILGIVGGSGSGKSVLMQIMLGLMKPQEGSVRVLGDELSQLSLAALRRLQRRWGVLFQSDALFSSLTVMENVERILAEHASLPRELSRQIAALKISMVGLQPGVWGQYPTELSGGMRKEAGLARALALDPEILFLDEPTSGLDPVSGARFHGLIREVHETFRMSVVVVSHQLDTLRALCDRVAVIADRRIVATGSLDEVQQSDHPWIREFFHGPQGRAAAAE